ncbi:DUF3847 domain-containing protein [Facklamia sp. P12934]|uniref:DUF3847 domain-containing protein n=1 Tax=unclassified Facklamia TaxID=2622293 RepID=UPI003D17CAC1
MGSTKRLNLLKDEIENLLDEKEKCELELEQLKNQEKKIKRQISQKESKKRTKRLIERGAILESYIEKDKLNESDCDKFIENLAKYAKIKELNRYILNQLIDKIYVYDLVEEVGEIT